MHVGPPIPNADEIVGMLSTRVASARDCVLLRKEGAFRRTLTKQEGDRMVS